MQKSTHLIGCLGFAGRIEVAHACDTKVSFFSLVVAMMNLLKQTHPIIFDKILEGGGQLIQNLDSQIAQQILLILLRENITCLPIHDSFIVQYQHADRLVDVMETVFLEKLGKRGVVERTEGKLNREVDDDSIMGKFLQSWKDHELGEG